MFEGVYGRTSVEVNGIPVAEHAYGYTEFAVDISETVCEGENIIKVTVDNHLEPNSRWYSGSGIYRPVHLMIKDCCHIRSVYVTTVSICPAVIGDFVWTAWDYLGEAGIGDWTYFSDEGMLMAAGCGTIDLIGTPGEENYFQQIVWNIRKEPYIGVRPITHCKEMPRKSRWRFTDAIASWSWHGYEGCKAEVEVYADAYQVELYHNHQRIGRKRINDYRVCFRTKYMPGILMAIALDETGKEVSRKMLKTAGETTKLSIKTDREMLQANGHDLCHIEIALTDENGIVKPAKDVRVTVEIEGGNAILMGVGSAKCKTNERLNGNSHMTHYGRALAIVKAGYQCGEARIRIGTEDYGKSISSGKAIREQRSIWKHFSEICF